MVVLVGRVLTGIRGGMLKLGAGGLDTGQRGKSHTVG